jgi:hypothetical protein
MFGFQTAEIGKTVHVNSAFSFGQHVTTTKGVITNIARDAAGNVAVIYANVGGFGVVLTSEFVLTVI